MTIYTEIAQKMKEDKKAIKVPLHPAMDVYLIIDKDQKSLPVHGKVLKKSSSVNFPDPMEDIAYIWEDAEVKEPFIKLTVTELERLSYFTADPETTVEDRFHFPWIWYDDKRGKTWVVATDNLRAILYRGHGASQVDDVKKTFPFPTLWNIFNLSRLKTSKIYLFPDINGRSYIKLRGKWRTLAVLWWENNEVLNTPPSFSTAIYPVIGIKKPHKGFTFKTLGRIRVEKKEDSTAPVVYIDQRTAINKGGSVQITMDFKPEHPIQFSGDILQLNLDRDYILSLCRQVDDEDIAGWYSFRLNSDPLEEEEYVIFPARVPFDVEFYRYF